MSAEEHLIDELASLRIVRNDAYKGARQRSLRGGLIRSGLICLLIALLLSIGGYVVFYQVRTRLLVPEVELGEVFLTSSAQGDTTLVATGYVQARLKATIAPKTSGRLARLLVEEGEHVQTDQLLAELESAAAQAQLAEVLANIAAAGARLERAHAEVADATAKFEREESLLQNAVGTKASYIDAKSRLTLARAQWHAVQAEVRAIEATRRSAAVMLENTMIRASFAGTVTRKLSELGEIVSASGPGILTIASLANLEVQADVSETQFTRVQIGTPAEVILDAFTDRRFRGEVFAIRPTVDRAKASVTVRLKFLDATDGVLPDMAAKVSFLAKALDPAELKTPPKSVVFTDSVVSRVSDRGVRKVLLGAEQGQIHEIPITAGASSDGLVELLAGPPIGTKVVRHPPDSLREGASVRERKR